MTAILGISAFYHDAAAALVVDGRIVAAAQEERFTRRKHDESFPSQAIQYCLDEAGLTAGDLDFVGFYEKPLLKFERLLETYLDFAPRGWRSFVSAMPSWLRQKLYLRRVIHRGLEGQYRRRVVFCEHHESHAASAFFPSPFEEAAILTVDGVGEWATTTFGTGRGNRIDLTHEIRFPHSLGLLYSAFTYYCGFRVNSGEYKLMGLAPYGRPIYADLIRERLIDVRPDGSFHMNMEYFKYCVGLAMTSQKFHRLFGRGPRAAESEITQLDMDLAASLQCVVEEIMLKCAIHVHEQTGMLRLCMAGGVALNCVSNGRLLREGPFHEIWVQPAAGDAGGALGVALLIWHQLLNRGREPQPTDTQSGSLLGPQYTSDQAAESLTQLGAVFHRLHSEEAVASCVAEELDAGRVVGFFQGRMEFGPRALGARSILGDARNADMQRTMNLKIKFRESFRPFAPAVLQPRAADYFDVPFNHESPYMLLVSPVRDQLRITREHDAQPIQLSDRNAVRSEIPAVTHVDYSARVQTVDAQRSPRLYQVLRAFEERTGCGVLINTSFNVRGEPVVCTPLDAYRCFMATQMDTLVLGDLVLWKHEQPEVSESEREAYQASLILD